jgi:vitamin B12 transporter
MLHLNKALVFAALFLCGYTSTQGQTNSFTDSTLAEVQVIASKFPAKLAQTGKVISVISKPQIQASLGKGLGELLQETVGISIVGSRSAPGTNQEVYVRGANTGQVLVLIDGFPVNDPSHISSVMDWNLINLANLERIEIMKGGQSTLYGSDAMAAVINLVTDRSTNALTLQGGGLGTFGQSLQLQRQLGKWQVGLSAQNSQTKGFSAAADQPEKDGFSQQNIRFRLGRQVAARSDWELSYQSEFYRGNLDAGPFVDDTDFTSQASNHAVRGQWHTQFDGGDLFIRAFQDITDRNFRNDSLNVPTNAWSNYSESTYKGINQGAEVYAKWRLPFGFIGLLGSEFRRMSTNQSDFSISSYGRYDSPEIESNLAQIQLWGNYLTLQKHNEKAGLEAGIRWNSHSLFGQSFTYNINPYWIVAPQAKVFANYATSFKAPSLYQLYSPYGNKALKSEYGETWEIGLEHSVGKWASRVVGFQNFVRDGIVFQSMNEEPYGRYTNFAKQQTRGIETELKYVYAKFSATGSYTYLQGNVQSIVGTKDSTYSSLIRRPTHQFSMRLTQQIAAKWSLSLLTQYVGARRDYYFDDATYAVRGVDLAGYVWVEAQASYAISNRLKLQVLAKNVLNQRVVELVGYSGQPLNLQSSLIYRF